MFPDSQIAQSFSCGAAKCAYLTCFGLYPYFHELLIEKIRVVKNYTVSFDESLNQKKQMDMTVRFWDQEMNKVTDRYFTSEFLGHATAADMFIHFKRGTALALLDPSGLVQVSIDGPNVNWNFYRDLFQERRGEELPDLLNIVSCGLHVVHGSFQRGAKQSGWNLANILRSLWQVFHDVSARREDFIQITGRDVFPLQFCQHRWVEDIKVADRALQIWPHVDKYVKTVAKEGRAPTSVSFFTLISACDDDPIQAKLQFLLLWQNQCKNFSLSFKPKLLWLRFWDRL